MNPEERQKGIDSIKRNIAWLHKSIGPDDIYEFAEQMIQTAEYFGLILYQNTQLGDLLKKDELLCKLIDNFFHVRKLRDENSDSALIISSIFDLE